MPVCLSTVGSHHQAKYPLILGLSRCAERKTEIRSKEGELHQGLDRKRQGESSRLLILHKGRGHYPLQRTMFLSVNPLLVSFSVARGAAIREVDELDGVLKRSPIRRLPEDVLVLIFSEMRTTEMARCMEVCRSWRGILKRNSSLWGLQLELCGCWSEVQLQWNSIRNLLRGNQVICLKWTIAWESRRTREAFLGYISNDLPRDSNLDSTFPFKTLEALQHDSKGSSTNPLVWCKVNRCENLRRLVWNAHKDEIAGAYDDEKR